MKRLVLLVLLLGALGWGCVDVNVVPALMNITVGQPDNVLFVIKSHCNGYMKVIISIDGATISYIDGFQQAVGNTITWEGEVAPNYVFTGSIRIYSISSSVKITYRILLNGVLERKGVLVLGNSGNCIILEASSASANDNFKNFALRSGNAKVLGITITNICDKFVEVPISVTFINAVPAKKALLWRCVSYTSKVFLLDVCAWDSLSGAPVKYCAKWERSGKFVTIEEVRSSRPFKAINEHGVCKVVRVEPDILYRLRERTLRCLEWRCARWTKVPKLMTWCDKSVGYDVSSDMVIAGKTASTKLTLKPNESITLGLFYTPTVKINYIGSLKEYVDVPIASVTAGNINVVVTEHVRNYSYSITLLMLMLSSIALAFLVAHALGWG